MQILVCDVETTGLNATDKIVELAWTIFDTTCRDIIACNTFLFPHDTIPTQDLIRISPEMTYICRDLVEHNIKLFKEHVGKCPAICAHNAKFDRYFIETICEINIPWLCSYEDISFGIPPTKLTYMCADLEIPAVGSHRAINDVLMLSRMLAKCENLEQQITKIITQKKYRVTAQVTYEERLSAKDLGFKWMTDCKQWQKIVRADCEQEIHKMFAFRVDVQLFDETIL